MLLLHDLLAKFRRFLASSCLRFAIAHMLGFLMAPNFVNRALKASLWTEIYVSFQGTELEVQKRSHSVYISIKKEYENVRN